jgi:hypothetical protein
METNHKEALLIALKCLFLKDKQLIDLQTYETSISAKLIVYLQPLFPCHDVDHEYDKHGTGPKPITDKAERSERPDIVIHHRDNDDCNLIAMEIKSKDGNADGDQQKLIDLTDKNQSYRYQYGIHIRFKPCPARIETLVVYSNGQKDEHLTNDFREYLKNGAVPVSW